MVTFWAITEKKDKKKIFNRITGLQKISFHFKLIMNNNLILFFPNFLLPYKRYPFLKKGWLSGKILPKTEMLQNHNLYYGCFASFFWKCLLNTQPFTLFNGLCLLKKVLFCQINNHS